MIVTSTVPRDQALDLDSVFCLEGRTPIGRVSTIIHNFLNTLILFASLYFVNVFIIAGI